MSGSAGAGCRKSSPGSGKESLPRRAPSPRRLLVVLVQEAYRSDATVPAISSGRAGRVLVAQLKAQEDVVETAHALGLNLRYAPSMRNGALQSDRGNAILSSLPLEEAHATELPLVLQRRVAVSAAITLAGTKDPAGERPSGPARSARAPLAGRDRSRGARPAICWLRPRMTP